VFFGVHVEIGFADNAIRIDEKEWRAESLATPRFTSES